MTPEEMLDTITAHPEIKKEIRELWLLLEGYQLPARNGIILAYLEKRGQKPCRK